MHQNITSFADVYRELKARAAATKRFSHGLEHMHELLDVLDNPHKRLRVVHVAGTSGKTSTAYYVASLLKESGIKVGLTVSPHIVDVHERVQINLEPMPEAQFCRRLDEFLQLIKPCRVVPNYFELFIAFAFWKFAAQKLDYAVVEVGIGGLLDSTNVIDDPHKVCVITDIGYDHMRILGDTLPEIAEQKAGIIQLHNPVFCYEQGEQVMPAIRTRAAQKQADLHTFKSDGLGKEFDFLPLFQRRNFGLALRVARFVQQRDNLTQLSPDALLRAARVPIPGRMEEFVSGNKVVIVDIAHNVQKLHGLLQSVHAKYPNRPVAALVRMPASDRSIKRTTTSLREVTKGVRHIIFTSLAEAGDAPDKTFQPEALAQICRNAGFTSFEIISDPIDGFRALCNRPEPILLATGSTFLLNHVRPLLLPNA
jgi:dihydrofolate synthase/folylpolyglutamate synthase